MILLDLPTELLFRVLSYLPAVDLYSAQGTCYRINRIITDSVQFQYILRAHINGVEDLLPSDCSFHDRLELLQCYEKSWNNLQLNKSADFPTSIEVPNADRYILRDGYLICKTDAWSYGYMDLCSATTNKEASWVHIPLEHSDMCHVSLTFAVDQDLVISFNASRRYDDSVPTVYMFAFYEFTTGAPHPLSSMHAIPLPPIRPVNVPSIVMEVLGDYILVSAVYSYRHSSLYVYLMSWKTGVVTHLRTFNNRYADMAQKPLIIDSDNNLVALDRSNFNSLEICKLETTSTEPRLQPLCILELPPLTSSSIRCVISAAEKEWVPTPKHQVHLHSQSSRRRRVPFRSSTIGTVFFSLRYFTVPPTHDYGMIVSVAAILSATRSGHGSVLNIPWARWGPAATHIFPLKGNRLPSYAPAIPAGPLWFLDKSQLVIRDYNLLRKWRIQSTADNASSLSRPPVLPSKTRGAHWVGGNVETYLPYRDVVAIGDRYRFNRLFDSARAILIDREWVIGMFHEGVAIVDHIG